MAKFTTKSAFTVGLLVLLLSAPAFAGTINKSIKIGAGEESDGASSVNGSITVGSDARVTGGVSTVNGSVRVDSGAEIESASTVNGSLRIGDDVKSEDLETVNGTIRVGERCTVNGHVEAVNGKIDLASGTSVRADVENVNGEISLKDASVGGDIGTVTGDVLLSGNSVVRGNIIVEKPSGWSWGSKNKRTPKIVIGPGSTVEGVIDVEREVELYISETASVGGVSGVMSLDDAIRFSGDRP